jgi:hypothetical protein
MKYIVVICIAMSLGLADIHRHESVHYFSPEAYENATTISFSNGIVFDTRYGEPELPANLYVNKVEGAVYYLVQVTGPITDALLREIEAAGGDIIGYIPYYTLIVRADALAKQIIDALHFVHWTGIFQPAYKMQKELFSAEGIGRIAVQISPLENIDDMANEMMQYGFSIRDKKNHTICKSIDVVGDLDNVNKIARIPGVLWIQIPTPLVCCNNNVQWVVQTGWQSSVPGSEGWRVWNEGLFGDGIVLGNCDSGVKIEHFAFYDATYPITGPGLYPNHRKIVGYNLYEGASFGDHPYVQYMLPYHGTWTAGIIVGDDSINGGNAPYDGVAKHARLFMLDLVDSAGHWLVEPLTNWVSVWDSIYPGHGLPYTIQQSSAQVGKWNSQGTYLLEDASTDGYGWLHKDFLLIFPAGNDGAPMTIMNLGLAKNVICGGGTFNGISSNQFWTGSSQGPTQDNRIKPNIVGPAVNIRSADGATTNGYKFAIGTCGASTSTNGALGLVRQYLLAGFYPSGSANPADSMHYQSSALLRSMAFISADPNVGSYEVPSYYIGWGRLDIDSVLYFTGDIRKLIILDDTIGIGTGQAVTDSFRVLSSIPLRICIAWTDTAAAPNANPTLVNDLNLELIAPDGTSYHGNQYSGGQSIPNPGVWDNINVEECCRINEPQTGVWHVTVSGQQVVFGPQPFAYAITGDITPQTGILEGSVVLPKNKTSFHVLGAITNGLVTFEIVLPDQSKVEVGLFDITGRKIETVCQGEFPAGKNVVTHNLDLPNGAYFLRFETDDYHETHKLLFIK